MNILKIPRKLVRVEWIDAEVSNTWIFEDELSNDIENYTPCYTIGHLAYENDNFIRIAATIGHSSDTNKYLFNCIQTIPKGMIVNIEVLRDAEQASNRKN
jgi:hypothetical protein